MASSIMTDEQRSTQTGANPDLELFVRMALAGKLGGTSAGNVAAWKIAKGVAAEVSALDSRAVDGLAQFVQFAKLFPTSTKDALRIS